MYQGGMRAEILECRAHHDPVRSVRGLVAIGLLMARGKNRPA
jgi:hypothetical protein